MIYTKLLTSPTWACEQICAAPKSGAAYWVTSAIFMILVWLGGCWGDLRQGLEWTNLLGPALISPAVVGLVSLGTTVLVYLLSLILSDPETHPVRFKTLYAINIHCSLIFLLGEMANFLLMRTNLFGDLPTPLRGRFPLGLDIFLLGVDEPNLYLSIALHSTSVFLIWYLVVLSSGIRIATGTTRTKAASIAAALWGTLVLLALGAAYAAGGDTTFRVQL